jgi:hypothetical protein
VFPIRGHQLSYQSARTNSRKPLSGSVRAREIKRDIYETSKCRSRVRLRGIARTRFVSTQIATILAASTEAASDIEEERGHDAGTVS